MTDWSKDKSWMKESPNGIHKGLQEESFAAQIGGYLGSQIMIRLTIGIIIYLIIVIGGWLGVW